MIKTRSDSRIEIWSANYISKLNERFDEDKNVDIIQIEPGNGDNKGYIVEVVNKENEK